MNPDNTLTVNCVEAYPLDAFSPEVSLLFPFPCTPHVTSPHPVATTPRTVILRRRWHRGSVPKWRRMEIDDGLQQAIRSGLAEAQRVAAGAGSEVEKAEARVEVEVFEAIQQSMTKV